MKIQWRYLKSPKVIIGAVVLFIIVLFMLNRGTSSANTGGAITASQTDPALLAANTQLAMAGIAASVANNQTAAGLQAIQEQGDIAVALKTIDANTATQTTNIQAQIAALGIAAQTHAMDLSYAAQVNNNELTYNTVLSNNQLSFSVAKMAYDAANYSTQVNAGLEAHLSDNQLTAYETGTFASIIPTLKVGERDNALAELMYTVSGSGGSYNAGGANAVYVPPAYSGAVTYAPPPLPQTNWVA